MIATALPDRNGGTRANRSATVGQPVENYAGSKKLKNSHNNPLPRRIVPVSRASGAFAERFRPGEVGDSFPSTLHRNRSPFSSAGAFGPRGHGAVWTGSDREVGSVLEVGRSDFF